METPDTEATCGYKYSEPKDYEEKYACKKKLGIEKDVDYCRDVELYE